jgi:Mlc titration factor MtfA (ptsG expression regulator)
MPLNIGVFRASLTNVDDKQSLEYDGNVIPAETHGVEWVHICPVDDDADAGYRIDLLRNKGIPADAIRRDDVVGLLVVDHYFDAARKILKENDDRHRSSTFSPFKVVQEAAPWLFLPYDVAFTFIWYLRLRQEYWPFLRQGFTRRNYAATIPRMSDHLRIPHAKSALIVGCGLLWIIFRIPHWVRYIRRRRILSKPFPPSSLSFLETLPLYHKLSEADRLELRQKMKIFLAEKTFEACGSATVDEPLQIMIATSACLLLLHRKTDVYPEVNTILIYPTSFLICERNQLGAGLIQESPTVLIGQATKGGTVILAGDQVKKDAYDLEDGHNVVLHEFAHQLDAEGGQFDGVPLLAKKEQYPLWAQHFTQAFRDLQAHAQNHTTGLDAYGAKNPVEFFAVATECFFERPASMKKQYPAIYDDLKTFYQQDPARR